MRNCPTKNFIAKPVHGCCALDSHATLSSARIPHFVVPFGVCIYASMYILLLLLRLLSVYCVYTYMYSYNHEFIWFVFVYNNPLLKHFPPKTQRHICEKLKTTRVTPHQIPWSNEIRPFATIILSPWASKDSASLPYIYDDIYSIYNGRHFNTHFLLFKCTKA